MQPRLIVCEPQAPGFVHANCNASLLCTALLAYPQARATFVGEGAHCGLVEAELATRHPDLAPRVDWVGIELPTKRMSRWGRLAQEKRWWDRIVDLCQDGDVQCILLCSLSSPGMIVLKHALRVRPVSTPVVAVMHSNLANLDRRRLVAPLKWALDIRNALRLPHPAGLRFIALGEPILQQLRQAVPRAAKRFDPLDLPCLWAQDDLPPLPALADRPVRFGHFGAVFKGKGFETFCRLAEEMHQTAGPDSSSFALVGFLLLGDPPGDCVGAHVEGLGSAPLSADEYAARARKVDYAVWTGAARGYTLTASASFLDSLSYVKPGICLRSPFVEYYFERMGDIGYLCDDYDEMLQVVRAIVTEFPAERYRQQCDSILRGRSIFDPATLAPRLRQIVAGISSRGA